MNFWPPKPGSTVMTMTMSRSSRYGSRRRQRRLRLDREPGGPAGRPDPPQRRLDRLVDLDVERDRVAAGVEVLVEEPARLVDHQVGVERQPRPAPEGLDGLRAEGEIRDEVGVHHVEVDPVRATLLARRMALARLPRSASRMLAATRARPPADRGARAADGPAGGRARLRSPCRAAALAGSRRLRRRATAPGAAARPRARPRADRRPRRPPGRDCRRIVTGRPAAAERRGECSITAIGLAVHGVCATGFIGMRLTCTWSPRRRSPSPRRRPRCR